MYFFNIEWNYENKTTGRSKETERVKKKRVRKKKRGEMEEKALNTTNEATQT